jgi:feruloyl esterase
MHRPYLVGAAWGLLALAAMAGTPAMASPCTNLQTLNLEHTTITSATDVTGGTFTPPGAAAITGLPPFCRVTATLAPTADSQIKIEAWLPETNWNGRFLGTGGGGYQGVITYSELANGINAGFAAANSDLGTGTSGCSPLFCGDDGNKGNALAIAFGEPATPSTGLFGHPEKIKDFGYRAIHLMTVRGKEIVKAFYSHHANTAYFAGCSTGGQNALMEAQRFPHDYDGILAGAAAFNRTHLHMGALTLWQDANASASRFILPAQMPVINKAVIAQCVGRDGGVKTDQFLTDPRDCRFDPKVLQCQGGAVPPACLTPDQVTTMRKYYLGAIDPVNGDVINPGPARGSETDNVLALGLVFAEQLPEPAFDGLFYWVYGASFGMQSSPVNFANFDFHHDIKPVDDQLEAVLNATSTDLSEFRGHGGKLLMYHGWADPLLPSQSSINYFNALVHNGRGFPLPVRFDDSDPALRQTQTYARLFMVPGMWHCSGGPGPNTFDALTPLVNWVEKGIAPETITATKYVNDTPASGVQMTRPLCVFPKVAKYNGHGDTNAAASFICVPDEADFNQMPAPQYGP